MHRAEEDYIKAIYELSINQDSNIIKNIEIADRLGFTDQSVNEMIKKLAAKSFLEYIPYKGVTLTDKGRNQAVRLIRAHRVWEVFLSNYLGFTWEQVHDEAEMLEHAGSNELIEKLYKFIGSPKTCGHGNPIPDSDGNIINDYDKSLHSFNAGDKFVLKRVLDKKDLLHYLDSIDINIGDMINVLDHDSFNKLITITKDGKKITISYQVSKMLFGIKK